MTWLRKRGQSSRLAVAVGCRGQESCSCRLQEKGFGMLAKRGKRIACRSQDHLHLSEETNKERSRKGIVCAT